MKFDLGAFAAGFATKAQEIEEESAKIGMGLINEAIEDFREESKDWKSKYDEELSDWENLAGYVKEMVGDDARAIAVLRKGKAFTADFVKTARTRAEELGLDSPADLIEFGDSTLPKNLSVEDWVRSGAPDLSLPTKPFLDSEQFKEFRTGVFGRQIAPESEGRVQRTTETYLGGPDKPKTTVAMPDVDIDLYGTREVPGGLSEAQQRQFRKSILESLKLRSSALSGLNFDSFGNANYEDVSAEAALKARNHVNMLMDRISNMRSSASTLESAPDLTDAAVLADQFASEIGGIYDQEIKKPNPPPPPPPPPPAGQNPPAQTNQITQSVTSSQQYQSIVNPPTTAPAVSKLKRRQNLVTYLTGLGIPQQDAVSHAQQAIQ